MTDLESQILDLAQRARAAADILAEKTSRQKDAWLLRSAERLEENQAAILEANDKDLANADEKGISGPMRSRLELAGSRWDDMLSGLRQIAELADPVGEVTRMWVRPNGLRVGRMRIPLGVVGIIYESRPNVTVDAAALCVKAGNACILRGGSEAIHTNLALGEALRAAAVDVDLPEDVVALVPMTDRAAIDHLLRMDRYVDLMIPRGGPGLIRHVTENSTIPVLRHDAGVCHIYLDESAELEMARSVVLDSKLRQVSVCNGLETLLAHRSTIDGVLPEVLKALHEEGVEIRGCATTCRIFGDAIAAEDADWAEEYLDRILAVRVVDDMDAAIEHIRRYGSDHTEVIITENVHRAQAFLRRVNSSTVGVNCSTAFADGYRLGLGAEIGISTSKLHAYGPMGLEGLTTQKFILQGEGQLRE